MSNCPTCQKKLGFIEVLKASNPARITCSGCKEKIKINGFHALIGVVLVLPLSLVIFSLLMQAKIGGVGVLLAMVAFGILVEVIYYQLIIKGVVKSTLLRV